ncbi:Phage protein [Rhodovulum sp. P5]|uniref:DUF3164 family protein n=1 Tax=Rhodovulum phage vB_RhkS_P1 TaxID=1873452 RepID=UPI00080AA76B|nr:DUF3164 family protein [Rhodovulum sp. P5]YP_009285901.1 DUF3164 family protein [Rhodovulum phage vB_RhkS_P1]ANT39886.1 hypothetical protein Rhks_16 [Rhodovulum phage vB_RhkS_P1]ARE38957.1 Phage protein [Rhodovulum sp. P5]
MTAFDPHPIPDGKVVIHDDVYMRDAKGALVPVSAIRPEDQLQDEVVRRIMGYAISLSDQIARFKEHTFDDIGDFDALLRQEYGIEPGARRGEKWKGNRTLMSYDGLFKVEVQVQDRIDFGPELQVAKELIDDCLLEWTEGAREELRAVITRAFQTDKTGQVNRANIFMLLRLEIADERWRSAMEAIRDAMRVVGTKTYFRGYRRATPDGAWQPVPLDVAKL